MEDLKGRCAECAAYRRCREAFGKHWAAKSHGGKGCGTPLEATPETVAYFRERDRREKDAAWADAAERLRSAERSRCAAPGGSWAARTRMELKLEFRRK